MKSALSIVFRGAAVILGISAVSGARVLWQRLDRDLAPATDAGNWAFAIAFVVVMALVVRCAAGATMLWSLGAKMAAIGERDDEP